MGDRITDYFDANYLRYDRWFETHRNEYNEQLEFLKTIIPSGNGIEIGVGTGRFAGPLGIRFGLDAAPEMLKLAQRRGVKTILGDAYDTKLPDKGFDFSLFYVTLCFLKRPEDAIKEALRISRTVISVILDRKSAYVQEIMREREGFYSLANFYTGREVIDMYRSAGLKVTGNVEKEFRTSSGLPYRLVAITGS
jgi:SAM-dependent methyltransferase